MARPSALLKRSLIFVHRWLGVALAALFILWFVSGIVMMYWGFPAVEASDRLERLPVLNPGHIQVSAVAAAASTGRELPAAQVRLTSFDGRPAWRLGGRGGWSMVFADDGTPADVVDDATVDRAAAAWARRPLADAATQWIDEPDQWTVGNLSRQLPLRKYSFTDGQQVYVSPDTAEVVQYTTTSSRVWAWLGAIPHWMYFTPLRKHQPQWLTFVVWTSLIGTIAALMGVVIAVWMLSPKKRYRHAGAPTSIPYRGWKRWHTITGLVFGLFTATWAFSGLLSMGPFPIMDRLTDWTVPQPAASADLTRSAPRASGAPQSAEGAQPGRGGRGGRGRGPNVAAALRGRGAGSLSDFDEKDPRTALASIRDFGAKELELTSFDGQPVYLATNGNGETRIVPVRGPPQESFGAEEVMRVVRDAAGTDLADLRVIDSYDAYYLDRRRERPLPVVYAEMNDPLRSRFYIDPKTARVVGSYNARNWVNRWLYNGLHSLNFPWLYNHRPLWDIVVITLMLGGTALCATSLVLAWRVLARKVAKLARARFHIPNDDLIHETLS